MSFKQASKPERVAVIDVGSNTIKLLVASRRKDGRMRVERLTVEETRIGEGITGNPPLIDAEAIEKGAAAICRLSALAADADALRIVATSAARDASNKQDFINAVEKRCGHELTILSGEEESHFVGLGLQEDPDLADLDSFTQLDLGGGSLECVQFRERAFLRSGSLRLGAVRLAALLLEDRHRPLTDEDARRIYDYAHDQWKASDFPIHGSPSPIAVLTGGAASVVGDMLDKERRQRGLSFKEFLEIKEGICRLSFEERVSKLAIPMARADIMPTAMITLEACLRFHGCEHLRFSHYNLRYGIAANLLSRGALKPT